MAANLDQQKLRTFRHTLAGINNGGMLNLMLKIGDDLGLFDAAAQGPASSQELAERAGLQERYVREWLGAMVTGGIFEYDADTCTYTLPPEHAGLLTGIDNVTAFAHRTVLFTKHLAGVTEAFKNGGGVPYTAFRPDFTTFQNLGSRRRHDRFLLSNYLPAVPGLTERLSRGLRACDVGCGTGHAANLMAQAFPASTFIGYDIGQDAIESARQEAEESGLNNASFEVQDVRHFPTEPKFDLITAFDAIHDQVDPQGVLNRIRVALASGGTFLMLDIKASSNLEDNIGTSVAPALYSVSVMHCMTVSLAHDGAGLGTVWGEQLARRMLAEAGFTRVETADPRDQMNLVYACYP